MKDTNLARKRNFMKFRLEGMLVSLAEMAINEPSPKFSLTIASAAAQIKDCVDLWNKLYSKNTKNTNYSKEAKNVK